MEGRILSRGTVSIRSGWTSFLSFCCCTVCPDALSACWYGIFYTLKKFSNILSPFSVCQTSGWNCTPNIFFVLCCIASCAHVAECASETNPSGIFFTSSKCETHAFISCGTHLNKTSGSSIAIFAIPYSALFPFSTFPPSACAISW